MRLTQKEIDTIKDIVSQNFINPIVYLFGSRVEDNKKGGDIDLFIMSDNSNYKAKLKVSSKLEYLLNKSVDVVLHRDFEREIEQEAIKGVKL